MLWERVAGSGGLVEVIMFSRLQHDHHLDHHATTPRAAHRHRTKREDIGPTLYRGITRGREYDHGSQERYEASMELTVKK